MLVQFSSQKTLSSRFIRLVTFSKWSHVEFILSDGSTVGARMFGGVKVRAPLSDFLEKESFEITGISEQFIKSYIGNGYDYLGLIGWLFRADWQKPGKWLCSELVADALQKRGVIDVGKTNRVEPRLLYFVLKNLNKYVVI